MDFVDEIPEEITSIQWSPGRKTVYNIDVEEIDTYFASGYLVHNK